MMEKLRDIFIYLGKNPGPFILSVVMRFFIYMTILLLSVVSFFSAIKVMQETKYLLLFLILILILDQLINRVIMRKHNINLLINYAENLNENVERSIENLNIVIWKRDRKNVIRSLKNMKFRFLTKKFIDSFTVSIYTGKEQLSLPEKELHILYIDHLKQSLIEIFFTLLGYLPFLLTSILLTMGFRIELRIFTFLLALIFTLFIRSSLLSPLFSLQTQKKIIKGMTR